MSQQKPKAARARPRRATVQRKVTLARTKDAQAHLPALPAPDDREGWKTYWKERQQPWRREPEIDAQRQEELAKRRASTPDVEHGIYPFRGITLTRADIEWLLVTHEHGRGPVEWSDESQRERRGLDVRGTDLHELNLSGLPLAGLIGGLDSVPVWPIPDEQTRLAAVILTRADLSEAQLKGAILPYVQLERADFIGAQLERAILIGAQLEGAELIRTQLNGANLGLAQ